MKMSASGPSFSAKKLKPWRSASPTGTTNLTIWKAGMPMMGQLQQNKSMKSAKNRRLDGSYCLITDMNNDDALKLRY